MLIPTSLLLYEFISVKEEVHKPEILGMPSAYLDVF